MHYSYAEIEYVARSFSPARTDSAVKLLKSSVAELSDAASNYCRELLGAVFALLILCAASKGLPQPSLTQPSSAIIGESFHMGMAISRHLQGEVSVRFKQMQGNMGVGGRTCN
jgi:hypothetical protein